MTRITSRTCRTWSRGWKCGAVVAGVVVLTAYAGPEWPEMGDAGSSAGGAQSPGGSGKLGRITGALSGISPLTGDVGGTGDFQDLYLIYIKDINCFQATLDPAVLGFAEFNSQLFLFSADGIGLLANDDNGIPGTDFSTLTAVATDIQGFRVERNGLYILGISGFNSDPANTDGQIFDQADPTEISAPDGPGGLITGGTGGLEFWNRPNGETGGYSIVLSGTNLPNDFDCRADCAPNDPATCTIGNGIVNIDDLLMVINHFGALSSPCDVAPLNPDGTYGNNIVNIDDLLYVINHFGQNCQEPS
ncbi:MAG: hypothetical protein KC983_03565 [Phycisphaerales bacterium]|nr:hypothetical protein [Phycisphaerales bacterium]